MSIAGIRRRLSSGTLPGKGRVMKKCLYLLALLVLLLQPGFPSMNGALAQVGGVRHHAPTDVILFVSPGGGGTCTHLLGERLRSSNCPGRCRFR